jgi:tripartite-type tricarboxylate transporter receptor subunit TctC
MSAINGALAADAGDFYRGKTVTIVVGYGPGGGYDLYARLLARHLGAHIPGNPSVIVQNMPGAAGMRAANYIAAAAPKDGTAVATFDMNIPLIGILGGNANIQYDPRKFTWLGSLSNSENDAYVLFTRKDAAVRNADGLTKPGGPRLTVGVIGPGATDYDLGVMLRDVFGFRLKIVPGYPNSGAVGLAIQNGEIEGEFLGLVSAKLVNPGWFAPGSNMHVILQFARKTRHPELPDAPLVRELVGDQKYRALLDAAEAPYKLARPYVAPPGIPADRAAVLQDAFRAASTDPALLTEARKLNLDVAPVFAPQAVKLIDDLSKTPDDVLARLRELRDTAPKK